MVAIDEDGYHAFQPWKMVKAESMKTGGTVQRIPTFVLCLYSHCDFWLVHE